jgi:hypothetical protein
MRKQIYFIVGLLIMSSFTIVGFGKEADVTINMSFGEPQITEGDTFLDINVEHTNTYNFVGGEPLLPVYIKTTVLPFGIKNIQLTAEVGTIETVDLSINYIEKIAPAPVAVPPSENDAPPIDPLMNEEIYNSAAFYPEDWYSYDVGVGLDENMNHVTFVTVRVFPVRYSPKTDTIKYIKNMDLDITYTGPSGNPFPAESTQDMVIIAPEKFSDALQELVDHKNNVGVRTYLKTTEEIYTEYPGKEDKPEQIKYFIKDAIETTGIKYVLLVGGLNNIIWANPMDTENYGSRDWHVPVRWSNLDDGEPGPVADLYYADIYKEGGEFDNWNSDNDELYAEHGGFGGDKLDMYPDVAIGRLACRNIDEVNVVVQKIISYEQGLRDPSWFNKIIGITGDGFLDQADLKINWDANGLPNGDYTLYAQSNNDEGIVGQTIEEINFKIDRSKETKLTFNHDDHLRMPNFPNYPADPMAEIMTISEGDILGNTDYYYSPGDGEAYLNDYFGYADVKYQNGVLHISGKTYDPKLYGVLTDIHVWIENSNSETVFEEWVYDSAMYSEGDWTVGELELHDRGGAFFYMSDDFDKEFLSSSNGLFEGMEDVINAFSSGSGFIFFSGHGSPNSWMNHFPGIPGNRQNGDVKGLRVINVKPYYPFIEIPVFPMDQITNNNELPIVVVGGCHNSMFTMSMLRCAIDLNNEYNMHTYGIPTPECWSWYLVSRPEKGAIATIGNTGYGLGVIGEHCTVGGVDNWITTEFFVQYSNTSATDHDILGVDHMRALTEYIKNFGKSDDGDVKTIQEWVLLGDPSLKIGGYPLFGQPKITIEGDGTSIPNSMVEFDANTQGQIPTEYVWSFDSDGDGTFDTTKTGETVEHTWSKPGIYLVKVKGEYSEEDITSYKIIEIENTKPDTPEIIGPTEGKTKSELSFTVTGSDPNNDELYYLIDWDDGGEPTVITPEDIQKGSPITHKWQNKGTYQIKVQSFDRFGAFNEKYDTFTISITGRKTRTYNTPSFPILERLMQRFPRIFQIIKNLL